MPPVLGTFGAGGCVTVLTTGVGTVARLVVVLVGEPPVVCIASWIAASFTGAFSASVLAAGPFFGTKLNCAARLSAACRVILSGAARGLALVTTTRSRILTSTGEPVSRPALSSLVTSTRPLRIVIVDR